MKIIIFFSLLLTFMCLSPIKAEAVGVGGSFVLTNQNGEQVTDENFRGHLMLVFFGFTHCPDLCPTTLATLSQAIGQLKDDSKKVAPIFITVDPDRDTPAEMKTYLSHFNPAIIGLTGTQSQIDAVQEKYKTYALKVADKASPGGYSFDHSAYIYLLDDQGKFLTVFTVNSSTDTIVGKIKEYLKTK